MATVIFDLDGTITSRSTFLPFLLLCAKTFGVRWRLAFRLPIYLSAFCLGMTSRFRLKEAFVESILSEVSLERLTPIVQRFVSDLMERGVNRTILRALGEHLRKGDRVILATASLDLYVQMLSQRLGIDHVVCTRAEVKTGVVTGQILGNNCRGEEKIKQLEQYLTPDDWCRSIVYTDHHADIPLLKRASRGFIVNAGLLTRVVLSIQGSALHHVSPLDIGQSNNA